MLVKSRLVMLPHGGDSTDMTDTDTDFFAVAHVSSSKLIIDNRCIFTHSLGRPRSDSYDGSPDTSVLHGSFKLLFCQASAFDQNIYIGCWRSFGFLVTMLGCP